MEYYTGEEMVNSPEIMERVHECSQGILDEFVKICEENGLRYYLAAGTLLGAIRHKGPIPWDDDIDVYMPRTDADTFKKLMLERADNGAYHVHCYENEPTFAHFYFHFNKRGTLYKTKVTMEKKRRYMELWIDIFPLDDCRGMRIGWDKLIERFILSFKDELEMRENLTRKKPSFKHKVAQMVFKLMSNDQIWSLTDWLMRKDNRKKCDYFVSWTGKYPFPMPKSWFEPACKLLYNGKYYSAPCEWDKILRQRYGDYMLLPPEDKRIGHRPIEIGL